MFSRRFYVSWIASALTMFAASYVWHGLILTDFSRLNIHRGIFLSLAAVVYLIIGFVVTKMEDTKILEEKFKRKPIKRGLIAGAICGISFFMISTVIGISFSTGSRFENLLLDVSWQTVEQTLGGLVVGLVYYFVYDPATHQQED